MPRIPSIRYYKSRKSYYTQIDKIQHPLAKGPKDGPNGPTYRAAKIAFDRLMDHRRVAPDGMGITFESLANQYFIHAESTLEASTVAVRKRFLKPFTAEFGVMYASSITPRIVSGYINQRRARTETTGRHRRWGPGTAANFLGSLSPVFAWGIGQQLTLDNPAEKVFCPSRRSRGRESILSPEDHRLIIGAAIPCFAEIALALAHTAARPGELTKARACDWDDANGCIVFHAKQTLRAGESGHKNSRKGRTRRIFFCGEELVKMRERVAKRPTGTLFRNNIGRAWNEHSLSHYALKLKKTLNLPHFTCYSWRHTFATDWIKAGKSIDVLAELMGNSPETIRKHYSHLDADVDLLRRQLEAFRTAR